MKTASARADDMPGEVVVLHSDQPEPLAESVRRAVRFYLRNLDGHDVDDIHSMVIREVERPLFETVLEHTAGNQTRAAQYLGISRSTLRKKLSLYEIGAER